ncbi:hypothetical protein NM208_g9479 [Fusarium decemcellulare]|uniref:Uncharacterized protein n=1 Tax=Fusarium decemcellulare TaxID=57161 RepID=A0ACC1S1R3_9HYPO|nr:hypothetical protein NM208_g9479 [Fusarium decemcellulare]
MAKSSQSTDQGYIDMINNNGDFGDMFWSSEPKPSNDGGHNAESHDSVDVNVDKTESFWMESNDVGLPLVTFDDLPFNDGSWDHFLSAGASLDLQSPMNANGIEFSSNDCSWGGMDWPNAADQLDPLENVLDPSTVNPDFLDMPPLNLNNNGASTESMFDNLDLDHALSCALNPESTALSQESIGSNDSGLDRSHSTAAGSQETTSVQQSFGHIPRHAEPAEHTTSSQSNQQTSQSPLPKHVAQILAKSYLQSYGWQASKCTASLPHETARRLAELLLQENGYHQVIPETATNPFGQTDGQRNQHVEKPIPPDSHPLAAPDLCTPQKHQTRPKRQAPWTTHATSIMAAIVFSWLSLPTKSTSLQEPTSPPEPTSPSEPSVFENSISGSIFDFDFTDDSSIDVSEESTPPLGAATLANDTDVPDAVVILPSTEATSPRFTDEGVTVLQAKRRPSHSGGYGSVKRLKSSFQGTSSQLGTPRSDSSAKSCMLCKMKHRSCQRDGAGPCKCCRHYYRDSKNSQSLGLARSICQLPDDPALDVRASIKDFFQLTLRDLISFEATGLVTTVELVHPLQLLGNDVIHMVDAPKFTFEVEAGITNGDIGCLPVDAFLHARLHDIRHALQNNNRAVAKAALENLKDLFGFQRQGFRILTSKLPSIDALIKWAQYGIGLRAEICPHDMEFALDDFLETYVNRAPQLPLPKMFFEISCLARFLDNRRPVLAVEGQQCLESLTTFYDSLCHQSIGTTSTSPYMQMQEYNSWRNSSRIHEEIRNQLVLIAANAIEKREMRLMRRFDELSTQLSRRRGDIYILSACQERMRLFYRRNRNRYSNFFGAADRFRNNKTMADFMTRRACFVGFMYTKGDPDRSPFSGYFKDQERKALKNDQDLIAKFERLKNAEHHFYEKSCDTPDDALYVQLQREKKDRRQKSTKTARYVEGATQHGWVKGWRNTPSAEPHRSHEFKRGDWRTNHGTSKMRKIRRPANQQS